MRIYKFLVLCLSLVFCLNTAYSANVITGLELHAVVQKVTPETGDDSLTVRGDSIWIVLNDSTRISFVVGYAPGSARLQGGVNKVIEFAFDSVFVDVDTNSATPIIIFGGFGGAIRWNRATDKMQFSNDLSAWSDIGTSSGISEADYNTLVKDGSELKEKLDSTTVVRAAINDSLQTNWAAFTAAGGGLTEEEVEDYVGTMVDGGTETRIEVTYADGGDGAGLLNFVVDDMNDGDAAKSEIHDSLDAHWTDFTTLDLDEIGNPSGDHTFNMANKDLKFVWTVGGGYDGGLELEATGNYSDEDLMHIHFHTGDAPDIDLLHIESDDPDVTTLHTTVPQDADTNAYFDNGVVFIDRANIDTLDIGDDVLVELAGDGLTVASNILSHDAHTGDVTGATGLTLGADVVEEDHIADNGIDSEHYNDGSIDTLHLNDTEFWEYVQDHSGGMFTGNTETFITVTYNEDGTVDFVVDDMNDDEPDAGDFGNATDLDANGALNTGCVADNEIDYANVTLTDFDYQTAFRIFYSNTDGDVTELALGADGTYLRSNGAAANPSFTTPGGAGDVTDVIGGAGLVDDGNTGAITVDLQIGSWPLDLNADSVWLDSTEIIAWNDWNHTADTIDLWGNMINVMYDWGDHGGEGYITATLTEEEVEDFIGGMLGGTETGISVTYEDGTNDIDFVVTDVDSTMIIDDGVGEQDIHPNAVGDDAIDYGLVTLADFTDDLGADPTHTHTTTTISGLDVSADINLTAGDHITLTDDDLDIDDDFLLNDGDVGTGVYDFGGATSLEIPAVDDPATTAEGHIAWDANDDAIEVYMGDESESALIPAYQKIDVLIFAPDGVNDKFPIMRVDALLYPHGIEIDQLSITLPADAAYTMVFEEWAADPPAEQNIISTVTTGASDSYAEEAPDSDAGIDADDYIFLDIPATEVDWIHCQIIFHVVAGN